MDRVCQHCGKSFTIKWPRNKNLYCSKPCSNRANAKRGEQSSCYKPSIIKQCETCGKTIKAKPSVADRTRFCSVACRIEKTKTLTGANRYNFKGEPKLMACEICGTEVLVRYSLQKRFRACSKLCASEIGRRMWPRTSSLEVAMFDAMTAAGLAPAAQHPVGKFSLDFAFPDSYLAIECDGEYWHGTPWQQAKDRRKDGYLKKHGWRILRLAEQEIRASPADCVKRIIAILQSSNQGAAALTQLGC